jgi:hypothetical protein
LLVRLRRYDEQRKDDSLVNNNNNNSDDDRKKCKHVPEHYFKRDKVPNVIKVLDCGLLVCDTGVTL